MALIPSNLSIKNSKVAKWGVVGSVVGILVLTILEFPPPIGFETRSQANVSPLWLILFLAIFISEIAAASLIFKKTSLGIKLAITAGVLNIVQIIADQLHLMQPDSIPALYTFLELSVGVLSLFLIYCALSLKSITEK